MEKVTKFEKYEFEKRTNKLEKIVNNLLYNNNTWIQIRCNMKALLSKNGQPKKINILK